MGSPATDASQMDIDVGLPTIEGRAAFAQVLARLRGEGAPDPVHIGRYEFQRRLGAGGMGVVYLVRDPELDRLVALKLLRAQLEPADAAERSARAQGMRREARAMARLDHPNVVRVLEVGEHEGRTYFAMEYVEGTTLGHWLRADPSRGWRELVRVFLAAGEGLAAAHAAGLAHCDFKPDNVLIGEAGAIKVSDFGLVRGQDAGLIEVLAADDDAQTVASLSGLCGTPAFMAPEQFRGHRGHANSDQFSFCVALYTALHGAAPFPGQSVGELRRQVLAGLDPASPASVRRVPRSVHRALIRGLALDPDARWPSMQALLDELRRALDARRRWLVRGALGLALLSAGAVVGAEAWERRTQRVLHEGCVAEGEALAEVWGAEARERLRANMRASAAPYAAQTEAQVVASFDRYAMDWQVARTEACVDAEVHGTLSADTLARARWCLDGRRVELEALIAELSRADANLEHAVEATSELSSVVPCVDVVRLQSQPPLPDDREALAAVQAQLSRVGALQATGAIEAGLAEIAAVQTDADALGWAPLSARVRSRHGALLAAKGSNVEAEVAYEDAYFQAAAAGARELALTTSLELIGLVGYALARPDEGERWSRHAEVLLQALGEHERGPHRARYLSMRATLHAGAGAFDEAIATHTRAIDELSALYGPEHPRLIDALASLTAIHMSRGAVSEAWPVAERLLHLAELTLGAEHPRTAKVRLNFALLHTMKGDYETAARMLEVVVSTWERTLGPDSTVLASALINLGANQSELGEYAAAERTLLRALDIQERALASNDPGIAATLHTLGGLYKQRREPAKAKAALERALDITRANHGPEHHQVAALMNVLAGAHVQLGDFAGAETLYADALAMQERTLGPDEQVVAYTLANLAEVRRRREGCVEARGMYTRALGIFEANLGLEHPGAAFVMIGLARCLGDEGDWAEALELGERALQVREGAEEPAEVLAEARFALVELLWAAPVGAGGDRERARELARQARVEYGDLTGFDDERAEIEAFLERAK